MPGVIPSIFDDGTRAINSDNLNNIKLRIGQVVAIHPPGDSYNLNKRVNEYQVFVQHRDNGTGVAKMYDHCTVMEGFGSKADTFNYTLRADKSDLNVGAQVLLLCINGESFNSVIIGSIRSNSASADTKTNSDGHHLHFLFNGVQIDIDKDGQLILNIKGPTDVKGAVTKEIGTTITADKEGNINIKSKGNVVVEAEKVMLGGSDLTEQLNGVVLASGIDTFTGSQYYALQSTSKVVFAKKQ